MLKKQAPPERACRRPPAPVPTFLAFTDAAERGGALGVDVTLALPRARLVRSARLFARAALCVVSQ